MSQSAPMAVMLYSSGTTGRQKGVRPPLPKTQVAKPGDPLVGLVGQLFGVDAETVNLTPAPLYYAASLRWSGRGARRRALPGRGQAEDDRLVRPILVEYYGGTEGNGLTMIDSKAWETKRGSVGLGTLRVCDDDTGEQVPVGEVGTVYWARDEAPFVYHNDEEKTKASQHPNHPNRTSLADIGYLDEDGFLFLTDRKSFTIISGGVNIYPQEIENVLARHPAIHDVAVLGVPDQEMGESVKAFVQPADGASTGPEREREIIDFVRSKIASFKAPRSVQFVDDLPRTETGKLVKGELKKKYVASS